MYPYISSQLLYKISLKINGLDVSIIPLGNFNFTPNPSYETFDTCSHVGREEVNSGLGFR